MIAFLRFLFWKDIAKRVLSYKRTVIYLVKKKGLEAAYNFIFVKLFVKHGEGSWGLGFLFVDPLLRLFPRLNIIFAFYPFNIEVEITTRCDKSCIICERTYWKEENRDLSFEEFKRIVDQFPRLKWVNLTGEGDAFLNKDYLKMIEYLKARNICVYLVDSFDLIDEDIALRLVDLGVDGIWVSFDAATRQTYENLKVGCNFEKTIHNIKNLINVKKRFSSPLPEICFRYVFTKLNVTEMPEFLNLISSLGSKGDLGDGFRIEFVGLLKFKETEDIFLPKIPEDIFQETLKIAKEFSFDLSFTHIDSYNKPGLEYCSAWFEPYIMMGGYVLPCCAVLQNNNRDFLRKYSFGNILETPFRQIWNSERYKRFRKLVSDSKAQVPILCKGCRVYETNHRMEKFGISL